ncbi:MAG: hypothetical protein AAB254_05505, partial [candidate division NC10 bacterium]
IVEEVRDAGAKLAEECGYDLHVFANMLRRHQKEANWPVVSIDYLKKLKMKAAKVQTADDMA